MTTPFKIIGLTGPKGSGKDTVASLLRTHAGFYPLAYADALREEVCDAWRFEPLYLIRPETKEHPLSDLALRKCQSDSFVGRMVIWASRPSTRSEARAKARGAVTARPAMAAAPEDRAGGDADPHGQIRRHREFVGLAANAVGAEIFPVAQGGLPKSLADGP